MTEQYTSAVPANSENKWAQRWKVAAVVLAFLYLGTVVRLIVSADWHDLAATKLFGLVTAVTAVVFVAASLTAGQAADSPGSRWQLWPMRGKVGAVLVAALVAGGVVRWILAGDLADPLARLLAQTGVVTAMLLALLGWLPLRVSRR
ncbi:hypothetical protein ACFC06_09865 [Nocardia sp. NPDC056064]|uniref:hypothetical protein n=1 Tax=Nocardia sp. NPDC056064 TaxID=3345701 RepID=UPI0035E3B92A